MTHTSGLVAPRAAWRAQLGLTTRGLEDVGTIHKWECLAKVGTAVKAHSPMLQLEWDGHHISDGDELYHTRWASVQGTTSVLAPMDGTLQFLSSAKLPLESETCLAEMIVDKPGLNAATGLVNEETYWRAVLAAPPGMFGAPDQADVSILKYSRYG